MNHEPVYRTSSATPGLLKIGPLMTSVLCFKKLKISGQLYMGGKHGKTIVIKLNKPAAQAAGADPSR